MYMFIIIIISMFLSYHYSYECLRAFARGVTFDNQAIINVRVMLEFQQPTFQRSTIIQCNYVWFNIFVYM